MLERLYERHGRLCTELMNMDTWTITYSEDDVREESAKMSFKEKGVCLPYTAEDAE